MRAPAGLQDCCVFCLLQVCQLADSIVSQEKLVEIFFGDLRKDSNFLFIFLWSHCCSSATSE